MYQKFDVEIDESNVLHFKMHNLDKVILDKVSSYVCEAQRKVNKLRATLGNKINSPGWPIYKAMLHDIVSIKDGAKVVGELDLVLAELSKPPVEPKSCDPIELVPGAYATKHGLDNDTKVKLHVGSIDITVRKVVEAGRKKLKVESIRGALTGKELPREYTDGVPNMRYDGSTALLRPNGEPFLIVGNTYSRSVIEAKLKYIVACGKRLHEIFANRAKLEAGWSGMFRIQI